MRKIKLLMTHILLVAMITATISPATVWADVATPDGSDMILELDEASPDEDEEALDATDEDESADTDEFEDDEFDADEFEDADLYEEDEETVTEYDEETASEDDDVFDGSITRPTVTDTRPITKIDAPEMKECSFEYKPILKRVLEKLPKTITIWHEDKSNTIEIVWKCEEDYNEPLDENIFVPDLEGYILEKDVELPRITVSYEKQDMEHVLGSNIDENSLSAPVVEEDETDTSLAKSVPVRYSTKSKLPAVRDQNPYGTCWAHGTIGALEADLIHDGKAKKSINLSELHMAYFAGNPYTDPKKCRKDKITAPNNNAFLNFGGWINTGQHLLSNLIGAVDESVAPYSKAATYKGKQSVLISKDKYQVDNAYYYNPTDRSAIKKAIMNHGGVYAAYSHSDYYFNKLYNSYYMPYFSNNGGHQIMLVGWDDSFSRYNFGNYAPSGDGAWLVRNSWGTSWGDNGYFWMSYYDAGIMKRAVVVALDARKASYTGCYAYDGQGNWDTSMSAGSPATASLSYKVSGKEAVSAVGVEINTANVDITVTVKNSKTGKKATGKIHAPSAGFYTVKLKSPLYVPTKAKVNVSVKCKAKKGGNVSFICESKINANSGYPYYMQISTVTDNGFTLNGRKISYDPRIKLYTVKGKGPKNIKVRSISLNAKKKTIKTGKTFKLKATIKPSNATNKKVKWSSSNSKVASVSQKGVVKGKKAGKTTITVKARDGSGKKAKCKVTVKKAKVKVKSVSLSVKKKTLKKGKTFKLKAKIKPSNATNKKVTWSSSKKKVATVSQKGVVKAKSPGKAKITVKTKDGGKKASCTVTVKKK